MARILLVDDNDILRTSMARFLEAGGHDVLTAENGLDAGEIIRLEALDVIVTDLFMPGRQGLSVLSDLRKSGSASRVIAISGDGNRPPYQKLNIAEKLGADVTLVKPFTGKTLLDWVDFFVRLGPQKDGSSPSYVSESC